MTETIAKILAILTEAGLAFLAAFAVGYIFKVFYRPKYLASKESPESKFEEIDGFQFHYQQRGYGPDLLLIHGIGSSTFCWRHVWRDLAKNYRVTVIDLPGFGLSSKLPDAIYDLDRQTERLKTFLDRVHIKRTHILGVSMGAAIGMWLAATHPERVERVAAIAPAVNPKLIFLNPKKWSWLMHGMKSFVITPFMIRQIAKRVHSRHQELSEQDYQRMYQPFHRNPDAVTAFWKSQDLLRDPRLPSGLSAIKQPVLILYGEGDRIVPSKYVDNLAHILPKAKIVKHPSGGHHLMEDEPTFVVDEVKKFLSERHLSIV
jgi:pimeloyl-ACP methyl ester carboxylesterase